MNSRKISYPIKVCIVFVISFVLILIYSVDAKAKASSTYESLSNSRIQYKKVLQLIKKKKGKIIYNIPEIYYVRFRIDKDKDKHKDNIVHHKTIGKKKTNIKIWRKNNYTPEYKFKKPKYWNKQWDIKAITLKGKMYKHVLYSPSVTIGVVDSGISSNQSSLNGTVIKKGSVNLVPKGGFNGKENDEYGNKGYIYDKIGHGTMIAGQISGHGKVIGVYPKVGLHIYRVVGKKQSNPFWIMKGIISATNNKDSVINVSLGKYLYSSKGLKKNMEFKAWNRTIKYSKKHGSIIVASAGENGYDENNIHRFKKSFSKDNNISVKKIKKLVDVPALLKNVISVGSLGPSGNESNFSNRSKNISLFAPGGDTTEYFKYGSNYWNSHNLNSKKLITVATIKNSYSYAYGTSLASAKVSALLAEYIAIQRRHHNYKNIKSRFLKYFKSYNKKVNGNIIIDSN
ncbi:S8 family serine peptidase [Apilactobacillus kunkeei]|uniref:S8 family serine peptidase n=1 Tax=Apilactobacillus kunkeei TaxID=148814 RepID=UPI0006C21FF5|nr:S8 family serine peptidase [Apilactobacillus kunkeei]KOY70602.1 hypothetical protein RZ55_13640 [Apilactobacillus kunkeei]